MYQNEPQTGTTLAPDAEKPLAQKSKRGFCAAMTVLIMHLVVSCAHADNDSPQAGLPQAQGTLNGHEYVDLGLSVKWATCNVGGTASTDYGDYFMWGDIHANMSCSKKTCPTWGREMKGIAGRAAYDAARAQWGEPWRMPVKAEIDELIEKCETRRTIINGIAGLKIIGPNGNSIFLPATDHRPQASSRDIGVRGGYWTATPYENDVQGVHGFGVSSGYINRDWYARYYGHSIRAVAD